MLPGVTASKQNLSFAGQIDQRNLRAEVCKYKALLRGAHKQVLPPTTLWGHCISTPTALLAQTPSLPGTGGSSQVTKAPGSQPPMGVLEEARRGLCRAGAKMLLSGTRDHSPPPSTLPLPATFTSYHLRIPCLGPGMLLVFNYRLYYLPL